MMERIPSMKVETSAETEKKVLAYVTFSRHGETKYTDQYPDITEGAVESASQKGVDITAKKGVPSFFVHSPAVRAKGTADAIHAGSEAEHGHNAVRMHESRQIRPSEFFDRKRAEELFVSMGSREEVARQHHVDGGAFTDPSIIETPEDKRTRLYRGLEYLIRSLDQEKEAPHIVVVSHYELVSILVSDIFGDLGESFGRYNVPAFGEHVDVELARTDDQDVVTITVEYEGKRASCDFDRKQRRFV